VNVAPRNAERWAEPEEKRRQRRRRERERQHACVDRNRFHTG
jgi:hypothetical protein